MSSTLESYINHTVSVITADGRQIVIDDLVQLYRDFAKTPIPIKGQLFDGINEREKSLRIICKLRDMDRLEASCFAKSYSIKLTKDSNEIKRVSSVGDPIDVSNDLASVSSLKGSKYMAVIRKGAKDSETGKFKQWLEIWDKTTKLKSIDIDSVEEHGSIVIDSQFGNISWSADGQHLLYTAEYKPPKAQSYYKKKKQTETQAKESDSDTRGQEFIYIEDWGESFDGISHTVIAVLNTDDYKIRTIEMKNYSLGQPFWIGSGDSVGFIAWNEDPRRLGIVYCTNRLSSIYSYDLNASDSLPKLICGGNNASIRDPRPNSDGTSLVYLENESGGPHHQTSRLMQYNIATKTNEIIIDKNSKREIIIDGNEAKYGKVCSLFIGELPQNCYSSDGNNLIINCFTEFTHSLYLIDLKTKQLNEINFPTDSSTVLDIKDDLIVCSGSSSNLKPNVFVGKFDKNNIQSIKWSKIDVNPDESIADVCVSSYSFPSDDPNKLINTILISPKSVESTAAPTIILPHGGPHSTLYITYMAYPILFAKLGLKTLFVNYRGSIGVDEDYVNTLCGNVGDMDVKDVIKSVNYLSDKSLVDLSKLILFGGSHGGFLVTHISGQYPDMNFKACISRNPVVDMSGKLESSDIPDWGFIESFGSTYEFSFTSATDPNTAKIMFEKSPINWINNVKVPTLMLLGKRDRRVPMTQGLKYYRILKAKGVKTKCHVYDDKHDLAKVDVDGDAFVNICLWIFDNLNN